MARKKEKQQALTQAYFNASAVGVELDGDYATAVTVSDKQIEAVHSAQGVSGPDALERVLTLCRAGLPVRVSLVSPLARATRVDVTGDLLTHRAFSGEVLRKLDLDSIQAQSGAPGGWTVAGVLQDPAAARAGRLTGGLGVALPQEPVSQAYTLVEALRNVEVTTSPLIAGRIEGLSLALRRRVVDVTFTQAGSPRAYQVLDVPGTSQLEQMLGLSTTGKARLSAALSGQSDGRSDPLIAAEVARWVNQVAAAVSQVVATWTSEGLNVPRAVSVHGIGAQAPGLARALAGVSLNLTEPPILRSLSGMSPAERVSSLGAFLAASSYGEGVPTCVFVSPSVLSNALTASTAARATSRRRLVRGAALLFLLPAVVPVAGAYGYEAWTSHQLSSSQAELASMGQDGVTLKALGTYQQTIVSLSAGIPLGEASSTLISSLPKGVSLVSVDDSGQADALNVVALVPSKDSSLIADWVSAFNAATSTESIQLVPVSYHVEDTGLRVTLKVVPV